MIFQILLGLSLLFASTEDFRKHSISRNKQILIALVCVPLIILNLKNLTVFHLVYLGIILLMYKLNMGGADVKILIPLIFTLPLFQVVIFTILFTFSGLIYGLVLKTKEIPLILPITISYVLINLA